MRESLGQYRTRDGKSLSFRKWQGTGDVIIYLHGIESNSGWFSQLASQLAGRGFILYGIDRRGSGLNNEGRGDISDYNIFFDDIEDALKFVKEQNIGKKVYLLGICWGALLAVNYSLRKRISPDGLILLSPAIYRKVDLTTAVKIFAKVSSCLYPGARFKIPINDRMFTDNQRYIDFIISDKMRLRSLTTRFFNQIIRMETDFEAIKNGLLLPVILLFAGHDEIVDNERVRRWFNGILSQDKTIRVFDNFHHVMPFEEDITPLVDCINSWAGERESSVEVQNVKN
ncbi:MAG: alpha/beta fold hydrolase [Candidatus Omnitrophica bacterium]|nr:alpha/beta fold hydrolase [Candidatus Omnitrophota bacterium]